MGRFAWMWACVFPRVCACDVLVGMCVCHRCEFACACAGVHRGWSLHRHHSKRDSGGDVTRFLARAGKTGNGVSSRCQGGWGVGFTILLLAVGSWERTGPYGEGWPKLESTAQKPHQLQRRNTSTFQKLSYRSFILQGSPSGLPWTGPFLAPGSQE